MAQQVLQAQSEREKVQGLDQALSPTIPNPSVMFNAKGFTNRYGRAERIGGKRSIKKYDDAVFHLHFLPNGAGAYMHTNEPELIFFSASDLATLQF